MLSFYLSWLPHKQLWTCQFLKAFWNMTGDSGLRLLLTEILCLGTELSYEFLLWSKCATFRHTVYMCLYLKINNKKIQKNPHKKTPPAFSLKILLQNEWPKDFTLIFTLSSLFGSQVLVTDSMISWVCKFHTLTKKHKMNSLTMFRTSISNMLMAFK